MLTFHQKMLKYQAGKYLCPVPATSTAKWSYKDWIAHIDSRGAWIMNS